MRIISNINPAWGGDGPSVSHKLVQKNVLMSVIGILVLLFILFVLTMDNLFPKLSSRFLTLVVTQEISKTKDAKNFARPFYLIRPKEFYKYKKLSGAFYNLDLNKISKFPKDEFENLILNSLRPLLRKRLKGLIGHTLNTAMKYNVDPFWALAVMGTESHYNIKAKSYVNAYGPMQIMPGTAHFISKLLKKSNSYEYSLILRDDAFINIEMGIYYLGSLLKTFDGSYRLATTAYNMGPNGVRRRLKRNLPVGVRNNYLDKVRFFYRLLSKPYKKAISTKKDFTKELFTAPYMPALAMSKN